MNLYQQFGDLVESDLCLYMTWMLESYPLLICIRIHNINMKLQWNPSITDTSGNQHFVPYSKVSLTWAYVIFLVGVVLCNWAV